MIKRASALLIIEKSLVLAVSRKDNYEDFNLPGGKCNNNETFEEAAIRELKEETNLVVDERLQFVFERQDNNFIVKTFIPEKYNGTLPSDNEQKNKGEGVVKWITIEKLLSGSFGNYNENLLKHLKII